MNCRKLIQKIGLPVFLALWSMVAFAQTQVTGRITDASGAGIAGVTVTVKGTNTATSTNENGQYTITVPANGRTLVFSSVGYGTREENVNGRASVSTSLQTSGTNLNEVVVVAYGTRRRGDLTSAVASVSAKDFQKGFVPSSEQLIQGKVSGVQVTSGGGAAGSGSRIRIRGGASLSSTNDPLIVIDGVPVEGNGIAGTGNLLSTINPNDIESISVLKDASAANLYGSRASNGVIIVTTKKGTRGKVRFNFNTTNSVQKVAKYAPVLDANQIREVLTQNAADSNYVKLLGTANTNWQKEIYRQAFGSDNNLSATGQIGWLPFRISGGFLHQDGVLRKNKFDRLSAALNLSPKFLDDHLSVNLNGKFSNIRNDFSAQSAIGQAVYFDPTQPVFSNNKVFGGYFEWMQPGSTTDVIPLAPRNPLAAINYTDNQSTVNRFIGNAQVDYKLHFFPDVHVIVNAGMDYSKGHGHNNIDSNYAGVYLSGGSRSDYKQSLNNQLLDVQLAYNKDIKSISTKVDVMVGHTYQNFEYKNYTLPTFSYRAVAYPNSPTLAPRKDTISDPINNPYVPASYAIESYIGRVNFNILDKYVLQGSIRRDASSKLSPGNRIGYFPAVSAAWKLKEEFLPSSNFVSDLKFRGGWGKTGQQDAIDYYSYLVRYGVGEPTASYQFGTQFYSFYFPKAYDKNIRWEETATTNLGFDFGFFKGRLSGSVDYYVKKTKDLFVNTELGAGTNFANRFTKNIGDMKVRGWEFVVNANPVRTGNFSWDFNFNIAQNKREITKLLEFEDPNFTGLDVTGAGVGTGNFIGKHRVGYSPYYFYVFKQVYDGNGKPLEGVYEDLNRDGQINKDDRYFFKKPDADFIYGLSTQLSLKKWSLGASAHGQIGNYVYNQYAASSGTLGGIKNPINYVGNASPSVLETGFHNNSNFQYASDYFIQNASFLRIDNINLGYNFGRVLNNRASMRVALNVNNVGVITNYKGMDPEVNNDNGVEGNIYPRPRIYALSINLDF
jgi:TonB-linked SusC/RagA family outer membrane protein